MSVSEFQQFRRSRTDIVAKHPQCWRCAQIEKPDAEGFGLCADHVREGLRRAMGLTSTGKARKSREHAFVGTSGRNA
jgi:hypothetical protein